VLGSIVKQHVFGKELASSYPCVQNRMIIFDRETGAAAMIAVKALWMGGNVLFLDWRFFGGNFLTDGHKNNA
jgi:hypothetical protein